MDNALALLIDYYLYNSYAQVKLKYFSK